MDFPEPHIIVYVYLFCLQCAMQKNLELQTVFAIRYLSSILIGFFTELNYEI